MLLRQSVSSAAQQLLCACITADVHALVNCYAPTIIQTYDTPSSLFVYSLIYLKPQSFLRASASSFSTFFSVSSGRLQKKSMPVLSSSVLMFTT